MQDDFFIAQAVKILDLSPPNMYNAVGLSNLKNQYDTWFYRNQPRILISLQ